MTIERKTIRADEVKPGTKLVMADDSVVTITDVRPATKDPLFERAGGWANALEIRWRGGGAIVDNDDLLQEQP